MPDKNVKKPAKKNDKPSSVPVLRDRYPLSAERCAQIIDLELDQWPGQCTRIAHLFVEHEIVPKGMVEVYGMWDGDIADDSLFAGRPMARHGWLRTPVAPGQTRESVVVIDPTRWVFEGTKPYVYQGPEGPEYDEGMANLRSMMRGPPPSPVILDSDRRYHLAGLELNKPKAKAALKFVRMFFPQAPVFNNLQLGWLANMPPGDMGAHCATIYHAIIASDCRALIPIDFFRAYERGDFGRP